MPLPCPFLPTVSRRLLRAAGRTAWIALVLAGALACTLPPATAAQAEAPIAVRNALPQPRVAGQGEYRWFGLKLYDARLWMGEQGLQARSPLASPFALELVYARSLKGVRIAEASLQEIRKLGAGTPAQQETWHRAMERIFPDVAEGTRIVGIHQPGRGAVFHRDGQEIGRVDDPEFSTAFFSIWLAERGSAPALRSALLANASP